MRRFRRRNLKRRLILLQPRRHRNPCPQRTRKLKPAERPGLAELEKLLSRLTDKEGISAKDIVYETVQVLTDKGKMDPIVAAVLQNVSFPGA